jgi:hypothetical protein
VGALWVIRGLAMVCARRLGCRGYSA